MSTSATPAPSPAASTFDINTRVDEVFAEHGFAKTNDDGDIVRDKAKVITAIVDVLVKYAVATDTDARLQKALSKMDLYQRLFPHGPRDDDPDELESLVADYVATYVWSMTTPSYDGRVQGAIGDRVECAGMLLCRHKRGGKPTVYIAKNDDLIIEDLILPSSEKLVKVASKTRKDMGLAGDRRKSLQARVQQELEATALKATLALGVQGSNQQSAPALGTGK